MQQLQVCTFSIVQVLNVPKVQERDNLFVLGKTNHVPYLAWPAITL